MSVNSSTTNGGEGITYNEAAKVDPKLHFQYVEEIANSTNGIIDADARRDNLFVAGGGRALGAKDIVLHFRDHPLPIDRATAVLRCVSAKSASLVTVAHRGKWANMDHVPNLAHMTRVERLLRDAGFLLNSGDERLVELKPHRSNPYIGVLDVTSHLLDAKQNMVFLGVRKGPEYYKTGRLVRFSTVDRYAVHLPALIKRLDELGLLDGADCAGELPSGEAVDEFLELKAIGGRDSTIVAPAVSVVRMAQMFGEPVPVPKPH